MLVAHRDSGALNLQVPQRLRKVAYGPYGSSSLFDSGWGR